MMANQYLKRVEEHLRRHRPKEYRKLKASGELNGRVSDLADSIANWVNSQLPRVNPAEPLEQRNRKEHTVLVLAESDALREYLPRDEKSEREIGPSGGYED
jgi:hypothetical protein